MDVAHNFNLADLQHALTLVGTVVAILAGAITSLVQMRKLIPGWHRKLGWWILIASPLLLTAGGLVAFFTMHPFVAQIFFFVLLLLQFYSFAKEARPLTRSAVLLFAAACVFFSSMMTLTTVSALTLVVERQVAAMAQQADILKSMTEILKSRSR